MFMEKTVIRNPFIMLLDEMLDEAQERLDRTPRPYTGETDTAYLLGMRDTLIHLKDSLVNLNK